MSQPPFGKPFQYTETLKFTSKKKSRFHWLWPFKKEKLPYGWIVEAKKDPDFDNEGYDNEGYDNEGYDNQVVADMSPPNECRVSPVEPDTVTALYDKGFVDDLVIFSQERKDFDA